MFCSYKQQKDKWQHKVEDTSAANQNTMNSGNFSEENWKPVCETENTENKRTIWMEIYNQEVEKNVSGEDGWSTEK